MHGEDHTSSRSLVGARVCWLHPAMMKADKGSRNGDIWDFIGQLLQAQAEGIDRYLGSSNGLMEFSSKAEPGRARGQDTEGLSCEGARRWGGARGLG